MIRTLTVGTARLLFGASLLALLVAAGLALLAYRLVRGLVAGEKPRPVADAGFAALVAVTALAKAVKAEQERKQARYLEGAP